MTNKVHIRDTKTGHVHEVYAVDAREMLAQEDGRYAHPTGKVKKGDVVPVGTPASKVTKTEAKASDAGALKRKVGEKKADFEARVAAAKAAGEQSAEE